ncbi:transposable element Tc1 transposase [Trichonephila clavipes]|nr:transposable element Tc1 transposase [Trichonephila clavipes]
MCDRYWPLDVDHPETYGGDIEVTLLSESSLANYNIRTMQLKRGDETRQLSHMHYVSWPTHTNPFPCALLDFRRRVKACISLYQDNGPLIVHCRNCWEQWTRKGTHARKTGSGATRKTTRREDRRIVRQALLDPTVTRSTIRADVGVAIVPRTISRHLAEANLKSKRPFRALPLTPEHRQLRLQWCQARSMWNVTDWQKVVFSDESRFVLGTDDNRVRVWRALVSGSIPPHGSTSHCPHSWCNVLGGHSL